jgi:hypothetical protein
MTTLQVTKRHLLAGLAFTAVAFSLPVLAHHGWTGYGNEDFTLSGTIEAATLGNPHGLLKVRAAGGVWDVVLGPPSNQRRAGLTEQLALKGASVTA